MVPVVLDFVAPLYVTLHEADAGSPASVKVAVHEATYPIDCLVWDGTLIVPVEGVAA